MLNEDTPVAVASLPIQAMRDHLRLGTGFAEEGLQDGLIEAYLRAALAVIEGRTGKALLQRVFRWVLDDWRDPAGQALPLAPVQSVVSVTLTDGAGGSTVLDAGLYRLIADLHRPRLAPTGQLLPSVPGGGQAEVVFTAGFGTLWTDVPPDLRQAVLMLAADLYERRDEMGLREQGLPFAILSLIERWRTVRLLGGGTA
ncbi:MAG: head-tail connector protein [Rhodobacter sp.]|nr:head-tail connector protein [Rhodobacter sp.]